MLGKCNESEIVESMREERIVCVCVVMGFELEPSGLWMVQVSHFWKLHVQEGGTIIMTVAPVALPVRG